MQISELRGKSHDELKDMVRSLKKELFNLRFQAATGELAGTTRFRSARKEIARIQTMLNDPQQQNVKEKAATKKAPKAAAKSKAKAAKK